LGIKNRNSEHQSRPLKYPRLLTIHGGDMGLTLAQLTQAIKSKVDKTMETTVAESIAEHALGFFGFSNRIIDNALEPTDRNLFYQLQDYDLLTTESEETTLWDGREWRIHYWKFKPNAENFANFSLENNSKEENDDPYADIYDGMPADLWRERSGVDDDYEEPLF
tara:strand:- start:516 stop:1010 length:495 start_codon:yes stop_codon:yes gene_type:complete